MSQDMIKDSQAFQRALEKAVVHAANCRMNLAGCRVVPVWTGLDGEIVAHDIIHPETRLIVVGAGVKLTARDLGRIMHVGVDYITIQDR